MSETVQTSLKGTLRAFVAFVYMIAVSFLWYIVKKRYGMHPVDKKPGVSGIIAYILVFGLVASALAVQLPKRPQEAALYGALVGTVVFGVCNLVLVAIYKKWTWWIAIANTLFGAFVCATASLILYAIFFRKGR